MAENKTKPGKESVKAFLEKIKDEKKREDCFKLVKFFEQTTKQKAVMWGAIVGFGAYHYKYPSGREGDCLITGFSPRAANITLYVFPYFEMLTDIHADLGKYKNGKSCIYIKKLEDINLKVLKQLVLFTLKKSKETFPQK